MGSFSNNPLIVEDPGNSSRFSHRHPPPGTSTALVLGWWAKGAREGKSELGGSLNI
jgi:hypothetical protein